MSETKTYWQRFMKALDWIVQDRIAAISTILRAPYVAQPFELFETESFTVAPPTLATHGADIRGLKTVNLTHKAYPPVTSATTIKLWLHDGVDWAYLMDLVLEGESKVHDPIDTEGFHRIAASVDVADIGAVAFDLRLTPHNEVDP